MRLDAQRDSRTTISSTRLRLLLTDPLIDKLDVLDRLLEVSSVHLVTRFSAFIGRRMAERGIS